MWQLDFKNERTVPLVSLGQSYLVYKMQLQYLEIKDSHYFTFNDN